MVKRKRKETVRQAMKRARKSRAVYMPTKRKGKVIFKKHKAYKKKRK